MQRTLSIRNERFPILGGFAISRGAKSEAVVVVAEIGEGDAVGRGECVPYARYGESVENVTAAIESVRADIARGAGRGELQQLLPAGAARNALDCALWDLEAKQSGQRAYLAAGLDRVAPATTAFTLSLGTPEAMAKAAAKAGRRPVLKVKLGGAGDPARIAAVRAAAPEAALIVDANEAWSAQNLPEYFAACQAAGVQLIEQPLPAGADSALASIARTTPVCADESVHDRAGLAKLKDRYDCINIKLDKTGGLTEALALADEAQRLGFGLFVGCMVGTSLAMAPAMLLTPRARFVDLDGPLLLERDREPGLKYEGSLVYPPPPEVWG
jgi:L-alanine-DL-glutamate epimerase-like enolase superfamily enzyme